MSEVLQIVVPTAVMKKLEEAEQKFKITKEEMLIRALVRIIEEVEKEGVR